MFLIAPLPDDLQDQQAALERAVEAAGLKGDLRSTMDLLASDIALLKAAQPDGHRYHKGWAYHNRGLLHLINGDRKDALSFTVCGFLEDVLSRAEESPKVLDELSRPSAQNLVFAFAIPGPVVADCARSIRLAVDGGRLVQDPEDLLDFPAVHRMVSTAPALHGKRIPGLFGSLMEDRVFVGGYYGNGRLDNVLRAIATHLDSMALDGVVAADFVIPEGMGMDEHALMLLGNCHRAIFDFSEGGGQEQEFASLPDTMRGRTLVVVENGSPADVSGGMTLEKARRWGIEPREYSDIDELTAMIDRWLGGGADDKLNAEPPGRDPLIESAGS